MNQITKIKKLLRSNRFITILFLPMINWKFVFSYIYWVLETKWTEAINDAINLVKIKVWFCYNYIVTFDYAYRGQWSHRAKK